MNLRLIFLVLFLISISQNGNCESPTSKITESLSVTLNNKGSADIIISLHDNSALLLQNIENGRSGPFQNRGERINAVASVLSTHSEESQAFVIQFLKTKNISYKSFWISNQIYIKQATSPLIEELCSFPQVESISEEIVINMENTSADDTESTGAILEYSDKQLKAAGVQWGISKIEADQVWTLPQGKTIGEGVTVGIIDTGVRATHQSLSHNFREAHGWRDPIDNMAIPWDDDSHGTHIMATIAGTGGVGVAPGAEWIACRGCDWWDCLQSHLLECGQFMLCPTLPDGTGENCTMAPHIVSNSWGFYNNESFYLPVTTAWKAAGIIPFFAIGNGNPDLGCSFTGAPGNEMNVIGVGATAVDDSLYNYSSHGPAPDGVSIKPEISAPGHLILSAHNVSDNAYVIKSGTSMACPHAVGTAALLLSLKNDITFDEMKSLLFGGTIKEGLTGNPNLKDCGGISEAVFPNHAFGHGRINALNSVRNLLATLPQTTTPNHSNINTGGILNAFVLASLAIMKIFS